MRLTLNEIDEFKKYLKEGYFIFSNHKDCPFDCQNLSCKDCSFSPENPRSETRCPIRNDEELYKQYKQIFPEYWL